MTRGRQPQASAIGCGKLDAAEVIERIICCNRFVSNDKKFEQGSLFQGGGTGEAP